MRTKWTSKRTRYTYPPFELHGITRVKLTDLTITPVPFYSDDLLRIVLTNYARRGRAVILRGIWYR